ncbi:MAG TPA: HAD family phosphatase, partial [Candidatus Marinimicrobia bacterium]|nr:HAD family phosphatase [Candidatus Neomarinimicrobiota bacterium]
MSTSEIKAILFDLGNVLIKIDFSRVISEWVRFSGKDDIQISSDSILGSENEKYERGEISTQQFVSSLKRELKLNISDEKFLQGWNNVFVGETPGIRNVIDRVFSKYPLFVFSNTSIS